MKKAKTTNISNEKSKDYKLLESKKWMVQTFVMKKAKTTKLCNEKSEEYKNLQ